MTRYHAFPGGRKPFSPEEEAEVDIKEAEWEAGKIDRAILQQQQIVDEVMIEKQSSGLLYTFPDGKTGIVQTRDNGKDIRNIQGLASAGQSLILLGDTTTTISFRDEADTTHILTGEQMVQLGLAVQEWFSDNYNVCWAHKDALRDMKDIQGVIVEDIESYDYSTGWPV